MLAPRAGWRRSDGEQVGGEEQEERAGGAYPERDSCPLRLLRTLKSCLEDSLSSIQLFSYVMCAALSGRNMGETPGELSLFCSTPSTSALHWPAGPGRLACVGRLATHQWGIGRAHPSLSQALWALGLQLQLGRLGPVRARFLICKVREIFLPHFLVEILEAQHTVGLPSMGFCGPVTDLWPA